MLRKHPLVIIVGGEVHLSGVSLLEHVDKPRRARLALDVHHVVRRDFVHSSGEVKAENAYLLRLKSDSHSHLQ